MSIADAFADVPVALPVMIEGSESMENMSDETDNGVQNGPTATNDTGCPPSSGSNDSQDSASTSNKEQGLAPRNPMIMMHKVMQAAAAILQRQPQVREMEVY